jgi:serine/threonine protein kinase
MAFSQTEPEATDYPSEPAADSLRRFDAGAVLVGRFRIARWLGAGGMGEVYEATDTLLHDQVALKVIRPEVAGLPGILARFLREVQSAKKITHPGICRIYDLHQQPDEAGGVTFLTMELLRGETLRARLTRGPISIEEAAPIAEQLAGALAAAHRAGVVHCDFKSENIMLIPEPAGGERAVVTDFGLARSGSENRTDRRRTDCRNARIHGAGAAAG